MNDDNKGKKGKKINDLIKEKELKKVNAEIDRIKQESEKFKLESEELKRKSYWHLNPLFIKTIQALIGGLIAGGLIAGFTLDHFIGVTELIGERQDALEEKIVKLDKKREKVEEESKLLKDRHVDLEKEKDGLLSETKKLEEDICKLEDYFESERNQDREMYIKDIELLKNNLETLQADLSESLEEKQALVKQYKELSNENNDLKYTKEIQNLDAQNIEIEKKSSEISTSIVKQVSKLAKARIPVGYLTNEKAMMYLNEKNKPKNYTDNKFNYKEETINDDIVVIDDATGLMWQQSGSDNLLSYFETITYISKLNSVQYAGYNDWRLPTVEEAITLIEEEAKNRALFIGLEFDDKQLMIWTSDKFSAYRAWVVYFINGFCDKKSLISNCYIRAVRSVQSFQNRGTP
ncbi:MAG: DUF1566 domain-containing protein [Deltaproteobacteria bacterium]|nr:DUF1566 domain-containing protein [Deltaproteobacteria bacterium]